MKRVVWIFGIVALLVLTSGVADAAEKKYCRIGRSPVNASQALAPGERAVALSEDMDVFMVQKGRPPVNCSLKSGEKIVVVEFVGGKTYVDRVLACGNPVLSQKDQSKIPWEGAKPAAEKAAAPPEKKEEVKQPTPAPAPAPQPAPAVPAVTPAPPPPPSKPKPTVLMFATPMHIYKGQTTQITWISQNADSADIQPAVGKVAASGSVTTPPLSGTTTFTVVASGNGETANASVTISASDLPCSARKSGWGAVLGGLAGAVVSVVAAFEPTTALAVSAGSALIGGYLDGQCIAPSDVTTGVAMGAAAGMVSHYENHPDPGVGPRGPQGPQGPQGPPGGTTGGPSIPPPIPPPTGPYGPPIIP